MLRSTRAAPGLVRGRARRTEAASAVVRTGVRSRPEAVMRLLKEAATGFHPEVVMRPRREAVMRLLQKAVRQPRRALVRNVPAEPPMGTSVAAVTGAEAMRQALPRTPKIDGAVKGSPPGAQTGAAQRYPKTIATIGHLGRRRPWTIPTIVGHRPRFPKAVATTAGFGKLLPGMAAMIAERGGCLPGTIAPIAL